MAIAQFERTPSIIIDKDKTKAFFSALNQAIPTKKFWTDCKKTRESISSDDIDAMDALIAERLHKHE